MEKCQLCVQYLLKCKVVHSAVFANIISYSYFIIISESDWVPVPPKEKKEEEDKVFPKSESLVRTFDISVLFMIL